MERMHCFYRITRLGPIPDTGDIKYRLEKHSEELGQHELGGVKQEEIPYELIATDLTFDELKARLSGESFSKNPIWTKLTKLQIMGLSEEKPGLTIEYEDKN